ncbi:C6 transcription factor [Colletotrichum sojae]|uniref:C6 transcription factor n=1 Tax=Colletotrichum sojae TaxID=2175907 RepID=A0A8H6IVS5_9PEZI|nr:C6 transcription factor [Colletotrichum sojae]
MAPRSPVSRELVNSAGVARSDAKEPSPVPRVRITKNLAFIDLALLASADVFELMLANCTPRTVGDRFLRNYFKIVHPQIPILSYAEVISQWSQLWEMRPASSPRWMKEIVFTVLAIGARVCPVMGQKDLDSAEAWGEYFTQAVDIPITAMREPSLQLVHLLLLKATYAQHGLRPNDTFFYIGCAARTCIAMGYNRSIVVEGFGQKSKHYRLTFWITYIMDRATTLMSGRPSSFRDEDIDTPFPQNSSEIGVLQEINSIPPCGLITDGSFVRVMARMGKIADCIMSGIYSSQKVSDARDLLMESNIHGCESALGAIFQDFPDFLDFRNTEGPIGTDWQEVQRLHVGIIYYMLLILVHRPALVFTSFFSSVTEAQSVIPPSFNIRQSIETLNASARGMIRLAHESLSMRQPDARSDSSLAIYLVAACVTLLYGVLGPETTPDHARDTFLSVEEAIHCLEGMKHFGPMTGKTLSTDIMRMAKNVLSCPTGSVLTDIGNEFMAAFPWLDNDASDINGEAIPRNEHETLARNLQSWFFVPPMEYGGGLLQNLEDQQI